ncbi:MAG: hypothetical protein QW587_01650 [Candidatus Bathyarchaeia archaeon]
MGTRAAPMLLFLLTLSLPLGLSQEGFSYRQLDLTVYADGAVHVTATIIVDPAQPSIQVPLLGKAVENLLATDENGTLLPRTVNGSMVLVDTLGASQVLLEYDSLDLTSKVGPLWTLNVTSPVNFTLVFPVDATVVEMSQVPLEIKSVSGRPVLVLAAGSQEVSYVIGLLGLEAEASDAIAVAQRAIEALASPGLNLTVALAKLDEAEAAYAARDYRSAKILAEKALSLAYITRDLAANATAAILRAEAAIRTARVEGRTNGLVEAEALLGSANSSYRAGEYSSAAALAQQAETAAAEATAPFPTVAVLGGGIAAAAALTFILLLYTRRVGKTAEATVDLEGLYRRKPWLNPDQRRVIEFLAAKRGSAFEAEIREAVNQPKSSVWRTIRKLQQEGIVTVEQLRGQNYVTLSPEKEAEQVK